LFFTRFVQNNIFYSAYKYFNDEYQGFYLYFLSPIKNLIKFYYSGYFRCCRCYFIITNNYFCNLFIDTTKDKRVKTNCIFAIKCLWLTFWSTNCKLSHTYNVQRRNAWKNNIFSTNLICSVIYYDCNGLYFSLLFLLHHFSEVLVHEFISSRNNNNNNNNQVKYAFFLSFF